MNDFYPADEVPDKDLGKAFIECLYNEAGSSARGKNTLWLNENAPEMKERKRAVEERELEVKVRCLTGKSAVSPVVKVG
jgi:hypothetical protein